MRRYVTDAGDLLPRLHKLTRSDCTTRNRRKAAQLAADYDALEERIARIAAEEDLARVRPDLDGNAIMELLGVPPGPLVGQAWRHLKELRLDRGPLDPRRGRGRAAALGASRRHRRLSGRRGVDLGHAADRARTPCRSWRSVLLFVLVAAIVVVLASRAGRALQRRARRRVGRRPPPRDGAAGLRAGLGDLHRRQRRDAVAAHGRHR